MKNKGFAAKPVLAVAEKWAKHCQLFGHFPLFGTLIFGLGLAFASPAEAQMGKLIESVGYGGSIWFQIAWVAAILFVLAIVVIHEFSVILSLCPLAAHTTDARTNFDTTSSTAASNLERMGMSGGAMSCSQR